MRVRTLHFVRLRRSLASAIVTYKQTHIGCPELRFNCGFSIEFILRMFWFVVERVRAPAEPPRLHINGLTSIISFQHFILYTLLFFCVFFYYFSFIRTFGFHFSLFPIFCQCFVFVAVFAVILCYTTTQIYGEQRGGDDHSKRKFGGVCHATVFHSLVNLFKLLSTIQSNAFAKQKQRTPFVGKLLYL